ncbi:MAG: hypothetical protein L0H35_06195 [Psychrobacter sp.]|nr:hypothetical protein [Psychrobacter sp.]
MMVLLPVVLVMAVLYFYWNRHEPLDRYAIFATIFMMVFLISLLFLEPSLPSHQRIGTLFIVLPLVSYGAILFPEMNPNMPVQGRIGFGWLGLVVTVIILVGFKVF